MKTYSRVVPVDRGIFKKIKDTFNNNKLLNKRELFHVKIPFGNNTFFIINMIDDPNTNFEYILIINNEVKKMSYVKRKKLDGLLHVLSDDDNIYYVLFKYGDLI